MSTPVRRWGRLLVLTDRRQCRGPLVEVVRSAVEGGARAIVFREKDLAPAERAGLASQAATVLEPVGGCLIMAGAADPGRGGCHLAARDPLPPRGSRPASGSRPVVGRSCHDAGEVVAAAAEGVDYLTVSPVFATASKPGYGPALGLAGLRRLVALTGVPVYALGGVDESNAAACREAGAAGVAVMGAVMRADDPAGVVRRLVEEVGG